MGKIEMRSNPLTAQAKAQIGKNGTYRIKNR